MTAAPLCDLRAEEAALGAVLLSDRIMPALVDSGLKPEHFYKEAHRGIYASMLKLHDEGRGIDAVTLEGDPVDIDLLAGAVPAVGNAPEYARTVVELARWRGRLKATHAMREAVEARDEERFALAESQLARKAEGPQVFTKERLGEEMWKRMEEGVPETLAIPLFPKGIRRRTVTLVGGWTSHGKTVYVDQMARAFNGQGLEVWAYLNEMTAEERMVRAAAAYTGVDMGKIEENTLTEEERGKIVPFLTRVPWNVVECSGWSAEDIARDIRIRRPDVAVIDILHRVPYEGERDLARISRVLGDTAKLADCAVIATVHLNDKRLIVAAPPQPTLADIKGASALKQDADNVIFVWRECDNETGWPGEFGLVYWAKGRMRKLGGVEVKFDGARARFREHQWM